MKAGVIADDLTGAQEMGVLLVSRGLHTVVTIGPGAHDPDCDAVVIDTESRHVPAPEAAERLRLAVSRLRAWGAARLFKKVDSTLRGNIAEELDAFAEEVVFTPAYPAMRRIVRNGELYVNGIPVAQTEFARDLRSPSRRSVLLMRDAQSDADLQKLIRDNPHAAFAGSGGLGRAWVANLPCGNFVPPPVRSARRPVVICGSRHPVSRAQARAARGLGVPVLTTADDPGDPEREASVLAERAMHVDSDLLIVFGGDTSCAILRLLGIKELWPVRELMPGVALSTVREMMIVTKAGGFGERHIVAEILRQLT